MPLLVPRSALPKFRCLIPGCEQRFYEQREFERHVAVCAKKNRGEIEELSSKRPFKGTPFGEAIDAEAAEFMRREKRRLRGQ